MRAAFPEAAFFVLGRNTMLYLALPVLFSGPALLYPVNVPNDRYM